MHNYANYANYAFIPYNSSGLLFQLKGRSPYLCSALASSSCLHIHVVLQLMSASSACLLSPIGFVVQCRTD